ncbi:GWxTD domain-containing protein [Candidatus Kapabacteria bacterium]|nr:GWxTD domain-containing protein [Candidatus Kapabacteria bacterium]
MNFLEAIASDNSNKVFVDVIAFKSQEDGLHRADCFVLVPYSILKFNKISDKYVSDFNIIYSFTSNDKVILTESKTVNIVVEDYFESQGGDGKSKTIFESFKLEPGNYTANITIKMNQENKDFSFSRSVNILDYNHYDISCSGLMLLSSIEEKNSKLKITPYFSDNVSKISNSFFTFFEIYNNSNNPKVIKYSYLLIDENNDTTYKADLKTLEINQKVNQQYLLIEESDKISGVQNLQVILLKEEANSVSDTDNYLAISERLINFSPENLSELITDIDLAIRQLRYVASKETIDNLKSLDTKSQKESAFINFWKELDPTSNTNFNEAFDLYYQRVKFANENYKSYADGWLTDMGMIYITLGLPSQTFNDNQNRANRISYIKWVYGNGLNFIFEDRTGFGDYRLVQPIGFNEKYEYNK